MNTNDHKQSYTGGEVNTNEQNRTNESSPAPSLTTSLTLDVCASAPIELTDRQVQMLSLAALGLTNQQIADDLGLAVSTVANTLVKVYEKLQVSNRVLAVRWLVRQVGEEA